MNIDDILSAYLTANPALGPHGRRNLRAAVNRWRRFGLSSDCSTWVEDDFARFRATALATLKPRTIEDTILRLKTLLRFAGPKSHHNPHGRGLLAEIPWTGRKLKCLPAPGPIPSLDDVSALYNAAANAKYPQRSTAPTILRAMLVVAFNTGLRYGDLTTALKWDCYDDREQVLTLVASKTGKRHRLPVNRIMARHLASLSRADARVFPIPPKCDHYLRQEVYRLCKSAGVEPFAWQAMRRRAATSIELVHPGAGALLLGHSLPGMTFTHYIDPLTILRPANAKVKQPAAFVAGARTLPRRRKK